MAWTVKVDFGAGLVDIAAYCEQIHKSQVLHGDLGSVVNTCSFVVNDATKANTFLTSSDYLPVEIKKDGTYWFVGLVRPNYSAQVGANLDSLSVECVDKTFRLQKKIETSVAYTGYAVCDTATKAASILHQLFYAAGFLDAELSLTSIAETITTYVIEVHDDATYQQAIDDLCFEFGWTYDMGSDGIVRMTDLFPTSYSAGALDDDDLEHGLTIDKRERKYEAARVTWHPEKVLDNRIVFEDTTGGDGVTACKITVGAGGYYPDSAGTSDVYCQYQLDGYEIIKVAGTELLMNANGVTVDTFTAGFKRAKLKLYSATGGTITQLRIRGNVTVRDQNTTYRSVRYIVASSEKMLDLETKWINSSTQATRLANGLARWYQYAHLSYRFQTTVALTLGNVYTLTEAVLGASSDIRVVSIDEDEFGNLDVEAEAITAYTVGTVTRDDAVETPPATSAAGAAADPSYSYDETGQQPYENWDSIPATAELFDLRQPDCKSNRGRGATTKEIVYLPGKLYDEVGNGYDNLWSKFAGLGSIGVFKATTNLILDPEDLTTANWTTTSNHCTPTLSSYYWEGHRFTLLTGAADTADDHYVSQPITMTSSAVKSLTFTLRKGTAPWNTLLLWDSSASASRAEIDIDWGTATLTYDSGVEVTAHWYASNTVLRLSVTSASITYTNTHRLYVYCNRRSNTGGVNINSSTVYITAIGVEESAYPTLYTPTSRAAGGVRYPYTVPNAGTIECWVRPWHTYNDGLSHDYVVLGSGSLPWIILRYEGSASKFIAYIYLNGSNYRRSASTSAIASNAALWTWVHLKIVWNISAQTLTLYQNGVAQTDDGTGTVSGFSVGSYLSVGCAGDGTEIGDAQITDLLVQSAADTSSAHYTNGVPWFDPSEVVNAVQTVRINRSGIRLHNTSLTITDDRNRLIDISNRTGLLARDAAGRIIHDLGNIPLQNADFYLGHIYHKDIAALVYSGSPGSSWSAEFTPATGGNTNARGAWLFLYGYIAYSVNGETSNPGTRTWGQVNVCVRPSGTTWSLSLGGASKAIGFVNFAHPTWRYVAPNGSAALGIGGLVWCPIGSDGKIDVAVSGSIVAVSGGSYGDYAEVWQVGVTI